MLITDIINILGNEFSSIYCVNRQDQYIQIYRHLNENTELDELMNEKKTYETVIQKYIETNVFEEDRNKMRYRMKCARIGNADTFEKIVFAFASEDSDIRLDELGIMNLSSTGEKRKSIFSLLIK